jgi:hypothetical protein
LLRLLERWRNDWPENDWLENDLPEETDVVIDVVLEKAACH